MSISLTPASLATPGPQGLNGLGKHLVAAFRIQEQDLQGGISKALEPGGAIMSLPKHVLDQFRKWDNEVGTPEEKKFLDTVKKKVTQIHLENSQYVRDKIESYGEKVRLEFSMKMISKTMNGIQQLLSAQ